jgi:hypothetical protein
MFPILSYYISYVTIWKSVNVFNINSSFACYKVSKRGLSTKGLNLELYIDTIFDS